MEWIFRICAGIGSVIYVGLIFVVLVYGYISTWGSEIGMERVCHIVDEAYDFGKWFMWLVFVSGAVAGWKESMLLGAWSVMLWAMKLLVVCA